MRGRYQLTQHVRCLVTHGGFCVWIVCLDTVGPPAGVEVVIADEDDPNRLLTRGEAGEVLIRGPSVMCGYESGEAGLAEEVSRPTQSHESIATPDWLTLGAPSFIAEQ